MRRAEFTLAKLASTILILAVLGLLLWIAWDYIPPLFEGIVEPATCGNPVMGKGSCQDACGPDTIQLSIPPCAEEGKYCCISTATYANTTGEEPPKDQDPRCVGKEIGEQCMPGQDDFKVCDYTYQCVDKCRYCMQANTRGPQNDPACDGVGPGFDCVQIASPSQDAVRGLCGDSRPGADDRNQRWCQPTPLGWIAYYSSGKYRNCDSAAAKYLEANQQLGPDRAEAAVLVADCYIETNHPAKAEDFYYTAFEPLTHGNAQVDFSGVYAGVKLLRTYYEPPRKLADTSAFAQLGPMTQEVVRLLKTSRFAGVEQTKSEDLLEEAQQYACMWEICNDYFTDDEENKVFESVEDCDAYEDHSNYDGTAPWTGGYNGEGPRYEPCASRELEQRMCSENYCCKLLDCPQEGATQCEVADLESGSDGLDCEDV